MNIQRYSIRFGMGISLIASLFCAPQITLAGEGDWAVKTDLQALYGNYSGSIQRDAMVSAGLILSADYLDAGGFSLAANHTSLTLKAGNNINQQGYFANARYNFRFDALPGPLTVQINGHLINNNDVSGDTDNVNVIAPQISFINYAKTFYIDLGYARSSYQNNLNVDQFTPTLGVGFNHGSDWFQVRGYFIKPSNPLRAQNKSSTSAADIKWSHWFAAGAWHKLDKMQLGALLGDRIYAVDNDGAAVYNLTDIQRGAFSLALQWRLSDFAHLMLMGGSERYLNNTINNSYSNRFAYVDISKTW